MANKLYNDMNQNAPGAGNPMQAFTNFMNQMQGKNPNDIISQMVQSGQITQQQLNEVQKKAQQMSGMFEPLKKMFHF
jgi:hypothetical protein